MIVRIAKRNLKTKFGIFEEILYYDGQSEIIALLMGEPKGDENVLCRVHSHCIAAHIFNSIECDCREQMEISQALIQQEGKGVIIWLDQEGRGNGHFALIHTADLAIREQIPQTIAYRKLGFSEDARNYVRAAEILKDLGILSVTLLTNNPEKVNDLIKDGVKVTGTRQIALDVNKNPNLETYYADKIEHRGHNILRDKKCKGSGF